MINILHVCDRGRIIIKSLRLLTVRVYTVKPQYKGPRD